MSSLIKIHPRSVKQSRELNPCNNSGRFVSVRKKNWKAIGGGGKGGLRPLLIIQIEWGSERGRFVFPALSPGIDIKEGYPFKGHLLVFHREKEKTPSRCVPGRTILWEACGRRKK